LTQAWPHRQQAGGPLLAGGVAAAGPDSLAQLLGGSA
jgi:hypothetical protein